MPFEKAISSGEDEVPWGSGSVGGLITQGL